MFGKVKTGDLSGGQPVQRGMRADEIEEEEEHGNEVVGGAEGGKPLLCLVPGLELLVEGFDEIVGNVVLKTLDADTPAAFSQLRSVSMQIPSSLATSVL